MVHTYPSCLVLNCKSSAWHGLGIEPEAPCMYTLPGVKIFTRLGYKAAHIMADKSLSFFP